MKLRSLFGSVLVTLIILTFVTTVRSIEVDDQFIIEDGDHYVWFDAYGLTTVDMTGGHVGDVGNEDSGMFMYDTSVLNVSGGTIDYLHTYDSSTANISGGVVSNYFGGNQTISAHGSSAINVYDGANLVGGSGAWFDLYDSSKLNVYGGYVSLFLNVRSTSVVNIYDGRLFDITPCDYSTINVYGGFIYTFLHNFGVPETATVNIYGYDFEYNPEGLWMPPLVDGEGWWVSKLTGTGLNGTNITWYGLPDPYTHDNINLIPEPSTLLLFGLGIPALLRKRG
jgi:hypothetical protein